MCTETTKRQLQLFIQGLSQVATELSKGFYNNIQCKCGTFLEVEHVVDVKTMFLSAHLEHVRLCYYGSVLVLLSHAQAMHTSQRQMAW